MDLEMMLSNTSRIARNAKRIRKNSTKDSWPREKPPKIWKLVVINQITKLLTINDQDAILVILD